MILTLKQESILNDILNFIIPPSDNGKILGAAEVDFLIYIQNENQVQSIQEGISNVDMESKNKFGLDFSKLNKSMKIDLIDELRRKHVYFFNHLTTLAIQCYYQHDTVLEQIGLEPRPPFPEGFQIKEGELTLLGPVYMRGKIYRE
jgi:hypothetical protein